MTISALRRQVSRLRAELPPAPTPESTSTLWARLLMHRLPSNMQQALGALAQAIVEHGRGSGEAVEAEEQFLLAEQSAKLWGSITSYQAVVDQCKKDTEALGFDVDATCREARRTASDEWTARAKRRNALYGAANSLVNSVDTSHFTADARGALRPLIKSGMVPAEIELGVIEQLEAVARVRRDKGINQSSELGRLLWS